MATDTHKQTWCHYCYSETPSRRLLVHKSDCFMEQAWDVEGVFCNCHSAYRCRSKFHRAATKQEVSACEPSRT